MGNKKIAFLTLGCKVNAYETDAMEKLFKDAGYEITQFNDKADVYVVNTCSVTNMADRKSRQMLHKARKNNEDAVIVAVGCYVQASPDEVRADEAIDMIVGNNKKKEIVSLVEEYMACRKVENEIIDINDTHNTVEYEELYIDKTEENTRAYIKIQDGCNQFCSYCIIPYARGRIRSRKIGDIIAEVEMLASNGYKEIVITGIHISSYGLDLEKDFKNSKSNDFKYEYLLNVIEKIAMIDGIERIRLGSLEPRIISNEFISQLSKITKVCPHFHLSLQSGCDDILKRMNRKYTTKIFKEKCEILRMYYVNPALTTDIIVGFPGESDDEFIQTEEYLKEINFSQMHVFKYSIRKGTVAATLPNQVNDNIKARRSKRLIDMSNENHLEYMRSFIGTTQKVLFEEQINIDGETYYVGHNERYVKIATKFNKNITNEILNINVKNRLSDDILYGELE